VLWVLKSDLVLRLTPEIAAEALHRPHTRPMNFSGNPMMAMIYVSAIATDSDEGNRSDKPQRNIARR